MSIYEKQKLETINRIFSQVGGMINKAFGMKLYDLAYKCKRGVIVEIGSAGGLSTICLASGSKAGHNAKVYAIDPFNGGGATPDPTWWNLKDPGTPDLKYYIHQGDSFELFSNNIKNFGVDDVVHPIVNYSELAVKSYPGDPIELLFVDGEHRYNYVKMDLELYTPFMITQSTLVMHDADYFGVNKSIKELILGNPKWTNCTFKSSVFYATKK